MNKKEIQSATSVTASSRGTFIGETSIYGDENATTGRSINVDSASFPPFSSLSR